VQHVNIFTQVSSKSPKETDGKVIYLLETIINGKEVTSHEIADVKENWNGASLEAILRALRRLRYPCEVVIWTENPYVEMNIDRAKEWREDNYAMRDKKGEIVPDKKRAHWEKWDEILKILEEHDYKITSGKNAYTHWLISELKRAC